MATTAVPREAEAMLSPATTVQPTATPPVTTVARRLASAIVASGLCQRPAPAVTTAAATPIEATSRCRGCHPGVVFVRLS